MSAVRHVKQRKIALGWGTVLNRATMMVCLVGLLATRGLSAQESSLLDRAERLADRGDVSEARQALADWQRQFGESAALEQRVRSWFLAARLEENGPEAELNYLRVVIEGSATRYADDALLRLAQFRYAQGEHARAIEHLGRLRRDYPTSEHGSRALLWIARASKALGDAERACAAAEQGLLEMPPADVALESALREEKASCRDLAQAFTVQVAAFREEAAAQGLARRLLMEGYDAWVLNATPSDPIYRVRVGRGLVEGEAQALLNRLSRRGHSPFLVSQGSLASESR